MDPRRWGIEPGYHDYRGEWHDAPAATVDAVIAAVGAGAGDPPPSPMWFVRPGTHVPVALGSELTLEDGAMLRVDAGASLPPDLPLGYHRVEDERGVRTLVVTPARCHLPDDLSVWGWAVQLYAVRSSSSWGMGDLADLRALASWSQDKGAGLVLVNPLGAVLPGSGQQPSPYYPSSRRFRNPLYLRVEAIPGADHAGGALEALGRAGRALNAERLVDRDAVYRLKLEALEAIWASMHGHPGRAFEDWVGQQGAPLSGFATFCALAEHHASPWPRWPAEHRHPSQPGVAEFARDRADRVRFHQWLQWLLDIQLGDAGAAIAVVCDLPIGVDPAGADAWQWQDVMALGMRVGAPPDEFNTQGQDWGLPPFDPFRLRACAYEPFIETLRSALRHAGGLRIDHVMGLWRLFWIPEGAGPRDGLYVRYPVGDLLDLLALESVRAGAFVVGEDLGTVEEGVRHEMFERHMLSTKLVWFETDPPVKYPPRSFAAVTTHDLATIPGLWTGADLDAQHALGLHPNEQATAEQRDRLAALTGADDETAAEDVVVAAYRALGVAPSAVVTATLDDALGVVERPNQPGTADEWPNWRLALPLPLEDIMTNLCVGEVSRVLGEGR